MSSSIERELAKCRQSAEEGYALASGKYAEIKRTLTDAAERLSKTDREQRQVERIQNTELVERQRNELQRLTTAIESIGGDLQNLRGQTQEFSIVVYGRTEAGKSTLMEILTHGNGELIGKGEQRTTRDVRDYHWQGLKITDVPGICAFKGAEDERLALKAAKAADLILFLLTNDAPQPDEAACLAQLKSFGKPILGVINVKMEFHIDDDMDVEDLQDTLADTRKVDAAIKQFKEFAAKHNQDWSEIKFVATHLLSAYEAQRVNNPAVFKLSRFTEVENFILDKVRADGRFLRIKTFADAVAVPMSRIVLKIYEQSAASLEESDIWLDKRKQLSAWREKFLERSEQRIDKLHEVLSEKLDAAIANFAEEYYNDDKVNEHWKTTFEGLELDKEYRKLLNDLKDECQRKRRELSDTLRQELNFNFPKNKATDIELEGTTPWGKYISTAVSLAGFVFPPLRIASIVVGVLGQIFFDGKAKKIREAKTNLRKDLTAPSREILDKMKLQAETIFYDEILLKGVDEFSDLLAKYQFMLARLGKSQGDMAAKLFDEFSDLNAQLLGEAVVCKGTGFIALLGDVARIPGKTTVAFADRADLNFDELSDLLGERLIVRREAKNIFETVHEVLGSDFDVDYYPLDFQIDDAEPEYFYAVVLKANVKATNLKIAQQIAGVPIIVR